MEKIKIKACVNCGYCCQQSNCGFARYGVNQCEKLIMENGRSKCSIYDIIIKDPTSIFSPAFGYGCCSNINHLRHAIVKEEGEKFVAFKEIDFKV